MTHKEALNLVSQALQGVTTQLICDADGMTEDRAELLSDVFGLVKDLAARQEKQDKPKTIGFRSQAE